MKRISWFLGSLALTACLAGCGNEITIVLPGANNGSGSSNSTAVEVPRLTTADDPCAFGRMILNGWGASDPQSELLCVEGLGTQRFAFYKDLGGRVEFSIIGAVSGITYDASACSLSFTAYVPSRGQNESFTLTNPVLNADGRLESFNYNCPYCGPSAVPIHSCVEQAPTY